MWIYVLERIRSGSQWPAGAVIHAHAPCKGWRVVDKYNELRFQFPADGVFDGFGLDLGQCGSCGVVVAMEPEPGGEANREFDRKDYYDRVRTP